MYVDFNLAQTENEVRGLQKQSCIRGRPLNSM